MSAGGNGFRTKFKILHKEVLHWFPGHMGRGIKQMNNILKHIDCIIEIHDARIPLSGRCNEFADLPSLKPYIYCLNKADTIDRTYRDRITERVVQDFGIKHLFFTRAKSDDCQETRKVMPLATKLIKDSDRYNRSFKKEREILIIGVPNVGKSSMINRLRVQHLGKGGAAPVGALAGKTRSLMNKIKVSEDPLSYLLDTPGILNPGVRDNFVGLKLASVGCLLDHLVGEEIIADFILFYMNKHEKFRYVEHLGLSKATDNIMEVLVFIAAKFKKTMRFRQITDKTAMQVPDTKFAAQHFISEFRTGKFGKICMDEDILDSDKFVKRNTSYL